jgi:hypothetical protein
MERGDRMNIGMVVAITLIVLGILVPINKKWGCLTLVVTLFLSFLFIIKNLY